MKFQYELRFPAYMSKPYHPDMDPIVRLLNPLRLNDATTKPSEYQEDLLLSDQVSKLKQSPFSPLHRLETHVESQCGKYLQTMNQNRHLSKLAQEANEKTKFAEHQLKSNLDVMNYRHCVASQICPQRMEALDKCWYRFEPHPHVPRALIGTGDEYTVCGAQKKAVERCCGQIIQSLTRQMMNEEKI